ncbi:Predicted metal-dependent hydrolase, TIM-barrel fold [Devosia sp. YR412]|uniref:amidohydrolase family protein n=1 Tax=Devosia sp. YR412 TaxID=1881030 RepID=UPI0008BCC532|nr:amidohydrolase family protein [Devosia sp. YR412]SEQ29559.1 Predicted metal-dependent hydrolase, TIM-barrel fold [Devosia sp. YR412]
MTDQNAPLCLAPLPLSRDPLSRLPAGTVDSHFHVFKAGAVLNVPRSYTPQIQTLVQWQDLAARLGMARGVLVQPSVYGVDNSVLVEALCADPANLRGVVVIPPETSTDELARLDRLGVRGIRINLRNKAGIGLDALEALAPRIRPLGWHVVFQVGAEAIASVAELAERHGLTGIIDHLAFMSLDPVGQPLDDLKRALDGGLLYAKISAPYRLRDTAGHAGYRQAVRSLVDNYTNRLLWGSDWPHTELFDTMVEDADLIDLSLDVVPPQARELVFVRNAEMLYWSR